MEIRIRQTGAVMQEAEFRAQHPNTSFPAQLTVEILDGFGADPVLEGPQAATSGPYQISQRQGVQEISGKWFTKYVVGPVFTDTEEATAAQQEAAYRAAKDAERAASVRTARNAKLTQSDWTQVVDSPVDQAAWAAYRQALRDITTQPGFPHDVQWPTQPE